jgi:ABC-type lipoprotein export system ATPase subunit
MTQTILKVSQVRKSFGSVEVLHGVDLTLRIGERVALMGPSGSGKSTLLNCLSGIEPITSGEITLGDLRIDHADRAQIDQIRREQIGYVFQSFHLLPTLTALENIEFPGQLIGMPKKERLEQANQLLEAVGLSARAHHRPDKLSGGERQRVALARAVMHRPRLILADEPTGSLDSQSGQRVLDLLRDLSESHQIAVLLVTHDPQTTRICDRVVSMRDGRIVDSEA